MLDKNKPKKLILIGLDALVPTLVEEYIKKGYLPNFEKLLSLGSYSRAHSVFPGITPVNWATIATGAYPGTHGITDFQVREEGDSLDEARNGFITTELKAETFWEAAEKQGLKTATINFPSSWPPVIKDGYWVAGLGSPATGSPFELRSSSCYALPKTAVNLRDAFELKPVENSSGWESTIELKPFKDEKGQGPKFKLIVLTKDKKPVCHLIPLSGVDASELICELDEWTPWFVGLFVVKGKKRKGTFRFKVTRLSGDLTDFSLYVSQVMPYDGFTYPEDLGNELINSVGPMLENCGARGYERNWHDLKTFLEEGRYKALWLTRAVKFFIDKKNVDIIFFKWHFIDHIHHLFWGKVDPISPWFNPKEQNYYKRAEIKCYQAADTIIGELLPYLEKDYHLVVVSDHGHIPHLKAMSINNLLASKGLLSWKKGYDIPQVDWKKTKAYGGPAVGHIWINLKGRDPQGIVKPEDYEKLQEEIITVLLDFKDKETGFRPVAQAIKKREAANLGQWGERTGDVICLMREGYTGDFNWFPLTFDGNILIKLSPNMKSTANYGERKFIASKFQSAHGCGLPTIRLGRGTEEAVLVMAGSKIKGNYIRRKPANLTDVVPTMAEVLGIKPPKHSEGRIIKDFFM